VRDSLQIQWQIVDAEGGGIVSAPQPVVASRNAPDRAVQEIRSRVMGGLSYRVQQTVSGLPSPGGDPPSWQAFKEVDAGERAFRSGRGLEAINPLERAAALDTGQLGSWSLLLLAMTHRNLGTETGDRDTTHLVQADSIFELVDGRTDRLSPFEVTFLEVGKASVKGDYLAALRASREGARKYPRSLTPYAAGYLARLANRPHEAAYWFETVDRDAPAVQNWIFLWTQASSTYHNLGDFKRQLEWTRQYRERFPQAAGPYFYEIVARAASGEYQQVLRLLEDGYEKGLPPCTDAAWWAWGEFRAHGYPVFADSVLAQVVERYRASPDTVPGCLQRQLFEAQGEWKEVRDIHVSTGSGPGFQDSLDYKGQLAVYDARIGNREAALATSQQRGAMDSPYMLGRGTIWRARIAAVLGDHAEAVSLIKQAYDEGLMYWYPLHLDRSFESLRDDPAYREVIRPRDEDWHAPGAERNKLLLALIAAGLLSATLVWFLGRRRGPHTAAA
jgi:tetratricopeptide (TPR) repeat protein